jgi:hypothetical protein
MGAVNVSAIAGHPAAAPFEPPRAVWTPYETETVERMRVLRASWSACAAAIGKSRHDVRERFDPDYRAALAGEAAPAQLLTPLDERRPPKKNGPGRAWPGPGTIGAAVLAAVDGARDVSAIAALTGLVRSNVFANLSHLESRGMVGRDDEGIRFLTPKGVARLEALR